MFKLQGRYHVTTFHSQQSVLSIIRNGSRHQLRLIAHSTCLPFGAPMSFALPDVCRTALMAFRGPNHIKMGLLPLSRRKRPSASRSRGIFSPFVSLTFAVVLLMFVAMLKYHMLHFLATLAGSSTITAGFTIPPISNLSPLRFTEQGTFQLSVLEDLHYGEGALLLSPPKQLLNRPQRRILTGGLPKISRRKW
jgi:hypothetical protein